MRIVDASRITDIIEKLCIDSNIKLNDDILNALKKGREKEESPVGKIILGNIIENAEIAKQEGMPICQDTGMTVVFVEIGQQVHISGNSLNDAINEGVRRGYKKGYLRNSVVKDPIVRVNTGDNTPAVIHYDIVYGDKLKLVVVPKGFGSENMSAVKMLNPSDGLKGIYDFVIETVDKAGANPCPPVVVGVGLGGTVEKAVFLSKTALLRPLGEKNSVTYIKELEESLLIGINKLGIGPSGLGGRITALAVNVEMFPTHIAGLPVAVNISCHALRYAGTII